MQTLLKFLLFVFLIQTVACHDNDSNNLITPNRSPIESRSIDEDSLSQEEISRLEHYIGVMIDSSNSVIIRIAESSYTNLQIDTLGEAAIRGLFNPSEINAILDSIEAASNYMALFFDPEDCENCSYTTAQRFDIIQDMALSYRDNPEEFLEGTDPEKKKKLFSENPGCNGGFYACLLGCSFMTSGVGAVACVYACACGFCQIKPPGCN